MTISRRKMFGFLAAAPVMGAAVVEAVKAAPVKAEPQPQLTAAYIRAIRDVEDLDDIGFRIWADWVRSTTYRPAIR